MNASTEDQVITRGIRRSLTIAGLAAAVLVVGGGGWATFAEVSGAVVARGTVVVESNRKLVQHSEGGIVKEIHVRGNQLVEAGDLLYVLDNTITLANLSVILNQLEELRAQEARLTAERDGQAASELELSFQEAGLTELEIDQIRVMESRALVIDRQKTQLSQQIEQLNKKIEGYDAQILSNREQLLLVEEEMASLEYLAARELLTDNRVRAVGRERARLIGEVGELISAVAEAEEAISERRAQVLQVDEQQLLTTLETLQQIRSNIAHLEEQRITAEHQLGQIEIRAPQAGLIHEMSVHTIGGVVGAGETLLSIVPHDDNLVVEVKADPMKIDQLSTEQTARVRFPGLDPRHVPELEASLHSISPDLSTDEATGQKFYSVRLVIPDAELHKLGGVALVPGMPAEAFVTTGDRTVMSYLTKPIVDQIAYAFRER